MRCFDGRENSCSKVWYVLFMLALLVRMALVDAAKGKVEIFPATFVEWDKLVRAKVTPSQWKICFARGRDKR
jgi:hypothetical protein